MSDTEDNKQPKHSRSKMDLGDDAAASERAKSKRDAFSRGRSKSVKDIKSTSKMLSGPEKNTPKKSLHDDSDLVVKRHSKLTTPSTGETDATTAPKKSSSKSGVKASGSSEKLKTKDSDVPTQDEDSSKEGHPKKMSSKSKSSSTRDVRASSISAAAAGEPDATSSSKKLSLTKDKDKERLKTSDSSSAKSPVKKSSKDKLESKDKDKDKTKKHSTKVKTAEEPAGTDGAAVEIPALPAALLEASLPTPITPRKPSTDATAPPPLPLGEVIPAPLAATDATTAAAALPPPPAPLSQDRSDVSSEYESESSTPMTSPKFPRPITEQAGGSPAASPATIAVKKAGIKRPSVSTPFGQAQNVLGGSSSGSAPNSPSMSSPRRTPGMSPGPLRAKETAATGIVRKDSGDISVASPPTPAAATGEVPPPLTLENGELPSPLLASNPVLRRALNRTASVGSNSPAAAAAVAAVSTPPGSPRVSVSVSSPQGTERAVVDTPPATSVEAAAAPAVPAPVQSDPSAPPPPPPPGPGNRKVGKKELLETAEARKVLSRLNNPRIDEELKNWDRRVSNYEALVNSDRFASDPFQDLLVFPMDDVYVETTKPLVGRLPEVDSDMPKSVRDCMAFFAQTRKVIKYRSLRYGGRICLRDRLKIRDDERAKLKGLLDASSVSIPAPLSSSGQVSNIIAPIPSIDGDVKKKDPKKKVKKGPSMSVSVGTAPRSPMTGDKPGTPKIEDHPLSGSLGSSGAPSTPHKRDSVDSTGAPASPLPALSNSPLPINKNVSAIRDSSVSGSSSPRSGSFSERSRSASVGIDSHDDPAASYVLLEDLLTLSEQSVMKSRSDREASIKGIFDVTSTGLCSTEPTETRGEGRPITREYGTRVMISMQDVHIGIGYEEAFFFSAAFYDVEKKLRLTEDFHFNFNDSNDLISTLLQAHTPVVDAETKARRALFNLSYTSNTVYLVVRVNGLLRGSVDDILEPYTPGNNLSAKEKQKLIDQGRQAASVMYKYQQGYAWTAVQAFDGQGHLLLGKDTSFGFWKMRQVIDDDTMYELLANPEKKAKLRPMDLSLHVSAQIYNRDKVRLANVVDTMLIKYPLYDVDEAEAARLMSEEGIKDTTASSPTAAVVEEDTDSGSGAKKKKSKHHKGEKAEEHRKHVHGEAEKQAVVRGAMTEAEIKATQEAIKKKLPASMRGDNNYVEELVKELHEFEQSFSKPLPNTAFVNNLYVYPSEICWNTSKVKAKSLLVRAFLMPQDGNPDREALKAFYGTSSCANLINCATTAIAFEEKHTSFYEEMKIQLPLKMSDRYNLLFGIYSVSTKVLNPSKKEKAQAEELIGFAYLPLYKNKAVVRDNDYMLPIMGIPAGSSQPMGPAGMNNFSGFMIPNRYMDADTGATHIDPEKCYLKFKTRLVSSVYAQDEVLIAYFLKTHNRKSEAETLATLDTLKIVSDKQLLHFSPVIMGQLFDLLCEAKTEHVQNRCFIAILCMVEKIFNQTMTSGKVTISEQLYNYIYCHFDNPSSEGWVYEPFLKAWLAMLKTVIDADSPGSKEAQASSKMSGLQPSEYPIVNSSMKELSWFFLEIIYKSMVLKVFATGEAEDESNRPNRFSPSFCASLKELVKYVDIYRRRSPSGFDFMNRNLALFATDLCRIMDRGFVFDLISEYFACMGNDAVVAIFKFRFMHILTDFEHYAPLALPVETTIDSIESLQLKFWKDHWPAGMYLNELKNTLVGLEGTKLTRTKGIAAFRDLLWKHSIDERWWNNKEKQTRLAGLYFPFLLIVAEHGQALVKQAADRKDEPELRDWATCILWILQNCNWNLHLRAWWATEGEDMLLKFLGVLKMCMDVFSGSEDFKALREESIITVCTVLDVFFEDFPEELNAEGSKIYEAISTLVLNMLRSCRSDMLFSTVFQLLRNFIIKFKRPLFRYLQGYTVGTDLTFEVLNLCQNQSRAVILGATSILYLLLRTNSEEMGHFARMKLQSTLAISRLVKQEKCNYDELQHAMETMGGYRDPKTAGQASWHQQLRELISRHGRIIRDSVRIAQITDAYAEYKAELLYKVSLEYVNSPDLRITWLNNLANYHEKVQNYEEAAHCKVQIASLICDYLRDVAKPAAKGMPTADSQAFAKITPSIGGEKPLSVLWLEGTILSPEFSEDGFAKSLQEAVGLFQKSEHLECAIESLLILQRYFNENKKYQQLTSTSKDLATLSEKVFMANRTQSRITPNFYRVGFYGEGFGEDNGKEFIYRENASQRLADFTTNLVTRYEEQFGKENFQLLPNKPIEEIPNVDQTKKNYLQIVACDVYFEYEELNNKDLTYSDRAWGVRKFVFENPYSPDGSKPTEDVSKSWKRKNVLITAKSIPFILKRVEVSKKIVKILKPIESAIDLIQTIVMRLKQALNCTPPNTKTLQIILQGSILTQVNAGPLAIVRTFLGSAKDYPEENIEMLKDQTQRFIRSCQFGLRFNQSLIAEQPENAPLHEAMMKSFGDLRNEGAKYMDL